MKTYTTIFDIPLTIDRDFGYTEIVSSKPTLFHGITLLMPDDFSGHVLVTSPAKNLESRQLQRFMAALNPVTSTPCPCPNCKTPHV